MSNNTRSVSSLKSRTAPSSGVAALSHSKKRQRDDRAAQAAQRGIREHTYYENESETHLRTIGTDDTKRELVLGMTVIVCVIALTVLMIR